ncbi:hypothetical protein Pint_18384 [Pistacia integerrima]|uniref:Uncharacterized protein n=1 Tax=Pistacia integerrima TaxID=434235 RepID=A0ACC0YZQ8_9ROSI|nr:hypothetical protein Pint_18384 [Pistacia integerrima]
MGGFLDGTCPKPDEFITKTVTESEGSITKTKQVVNPLDTAWRRPDRLLRGWVVGTLSEEVLGVSVGLETLVEVCKSFAEHCDHNAQDREFFLMQELHLQSCGSYFFLSFFQGQIQRKYINKNC